MAYAAQGGRGVAESENDALRDAAKAALVRVPLHQRKALGNVGNVPRSNGNDAAAPAEKRDGPNTRSRTVSQNVQPVLAVQPAITEQPVAHETKDGLNEEVSFMDISGELDAILPLGITNIDEEDRDNPQLVAEYVNGIYTYLRKLERRQGVKKNYMAGYKSINPKMRTILVDWLIQVHLRFHLLQETLYLAIAILDRFLQVHEVSKTKLQLVGITAMLVASKYEEMYAPELNDFVYITDNAYTKANIRQMEIIMLKALNFDLGRPLPLHFLRRYSKAGQMDATTHTLAKYIMELSLVDYGMVHYHPSEIAAAALYLSMKVLDTDAEWTGDLRHYSTYSEDHLLPIMERLAVLESKASSSKQKAIYQKYESSKFTKISSHSVLRTSDYLRSLVDSHKETH